MTTVTVSATVVFPVPIPADIFTEPEDVSPDSLANLGPLRHLAGVWQADKGVDVNPKADGPERRVFREHIRMDPIDPQANGPQLFYGLRYHIHINTSEEDITFHESGRLLVLGAGNRLAKRDIPRGQVLLASGQAKLDDKRISVTAKRGDTRYGICSTEFWTKLSARRATDVTSPSMKLDLCHRNRASGEGERPPVQSSRHEHLEARWGAGAESAGCHPERSSREEMD
jgi:hypothetical protein